MTIKRNVQLPRSNREGVKPRADELDYGNLAVNFAAGDEFLSTKNSNNEVVVFPSKNYLENHPFSNFTTDKLTVNSGASIKGNTTIVGNLKVSGDTYVKSGTTLVKIENLITETAKADGNDYITGGSAANNTISLTGKGSARATITGVVTTDKVAEEVKSASNWEEGQGNSAVLLKNSNGSAAGEFSVSEGKGTSANGSYSHTEGYSTTASSNSSHAEGAYTTASGESSHAEGSFTTASGLQSHAEGDSTTASGNQSHAEGVSTKASGKWSHAEGNHTIAMNDCEHACGCYNRSVSGSGQVFSVGAGTSDTNRVNSFYVKNDGTIGSDLDMSISGNSKITLSTSSDKLIMSAGTLTTNCTMTTDTYFTTSDKRLKTNIIGVTEDEIEKAKKVDLKSFNLKRDGKKHFGVVAQEVETAGLAELVNTDSEGMKSVDYTSLLILKIAELEKEIKDLKNQINNK